MGDQRPGAASIRPPRPSAVTRSTRAPPVCPPAQLPRCDAPCFLTRRFSMRTARHIESRELFRTCKLFHCATPLGASLLVLTKISPLFPPQLRFSVLRPLAP